MNYINKLKHLEHQETTTNPACKPSHAQWLKAWRELATLTQGITQGDPRLEPVMKALDACDMAFLMDDWSGFQRASLTVRQQVVEEKGA